MNSAIQIIFLHDLFQIGNVLALDHIAITKYRTVIFLSWYIWIVSCTLKRLAATSVCIEQVGVGMCMEGIEQNPVVYELMSEMAFRSDKVQVEVIGIFNSL